MSKWKFQGEPLLEPLEDVIGFIYKVFLYRDVEIDGMIFRKGYFYWGQKQFYSNRTQRLSKKKSEELWSGRGRKPQKIKKKTESDWKTYCTSSDIIKKIVSLHGVYVFSWEIIDFACSTSGLDYLEAKYILINDALLDEKCLNCWLSLKIRKSNVCI